MVVRSVHRRSDVGAAVSSSRNSHRADCSGMRKGCGASGTQRNTSGCPSLPRATGSSRGPQRRAMPSRFRVPSTSSSGHHQLLATTGAALVGEPCNESSRQARARAKASAQAWPSRARGRQEPAQAIPNDPSPRVRAWCSHWIGYSRSMTSRQLSALSHAMKASFTDRASGWWAANLMPNFRMWRLVVRSPWMMLANR